MLRNIHELKEKKLKSHFVNSYCMQYTGNAYIQSFHSLLIVRFNHSYLSFKVFVKDSKKKLFAGRAEFI